METWRAAYAHAFPQAKLAALPVSERARAWTRQLGGAPRRSGVLVAVRDSDVIGFASFGPSRDPDAGADVAELYAVYVHPRRWRRGIGGRLLAEAADAMRRAEFVQATLWVLDDNPRARRAYEAAGWAADGAEKEATVLGDVPVTEVRYRLVL